MQSREDRSPRLDSGSVMRIRIAFLVLFTVWFSSDGRAQWEWPSYPPPSSPPYPTSPFDQSDASETPTPQRYLSRPPEPIRRSVHRSSAQGALQGNIQQQKLRKQIPTTNRRTAETRQKTEKAATGSVTSSTSAGTKTPLKPAASTSVRTKAPTKPNSRRSNKKETARGAEPASRDRTPIQHEHDLLRISSDAAKNPAVLAFRNCITSYFARGMRKGRDGPTWADLVTRATEGECRAQFDDMAQILSKRFGKKRVEQVMQQLIETTLLPAAKAAARGERDTGVSAVPPQ